MARMRSVAQIVAYCKEKDPETMVTEYFVRRAIKNGFPVVKTGRNCLVNLDLFIEYLNGEYVPGEKREKISMIEKRGEV